mmetsp:Transcript_12492/g.20999  ORF Transcript_12492/g.20999 Transcript_12492/m.20999 type:complete len:91 (-) Transcript_12492:210-482(-)
MPLTKSSLNYQSNLKRVHSLHQNQMDSDQALQNRINHLLSLQETPTEATQQESFKQLDNSFATRSVNLNMNSPLPPNSGVFRVKAPQEEA